MPVCEGCGGSYDDQFKFCPYCGRIKPKDSIQINVNVSSEDVWESCEIRLVKENRGPFKSADYYFEGTAIGPNGKYAAKTSDKLIGGSLTHLFDADYVINEGFKFIVRRAQTKLDNLVYQLTQDGWQSTGRGQEWYNERFRRLVKKT